MPAPKPPQLREAFGVIHLPALPGAPGSHEFAPAEALHRAGMLAVQEAQVLARAGFAGLVLENFGDVPFYRDRVPPETIAAMAVIAGAVREVAPRLKLGINVLRNDARAALAIAAVTGCDFIRVNVLSGVAASDQGILEGPAAELLRERSRLHAEVAIFADVWVKHAQSLSSADLTLAVEELALRAGADAVIVTGPSTGRAVSSQNLQEASEAARACGVPLYVGSGATPETLPALAPFAHGVLVGSALRKGGRAGQPLDRKRLDAWAAAMRKGMGKGKARKK